MTENSSLSELNAVDCGLFVNIFGDILEHSPRMPERDWASRPFDSISNLYSRMVTVVESASGEEQTSLLAAHRELAGKEAQRGDLTNLSSGEQQHAGLNALSRQEMQEAGELNTGYREQSGFPFIIAVRDGTREQIFK